MTAYKNLLAQLEQAKALKRLEAAQVNVTKSAAALSELEALIDKYGDTLAAATDSAQKGRAIKSRGIAMCHRDQGGPANGRSVSLLTKSVEGLRRVDINKASRPLKATKLEGAE
ncbi:hypothetical protein [Citrobacter koseri]|uniref:hypothetical protein n=1 Tax=Citrobacter koseri TaxID=545 RepID=UPI0029434CCB|nr:hypothetical protein [Citrobacter koseri]MEB2702994.1 hypothetical protein [Citrobacter koseri]MEB2707860.1 hypothetical protein [Citrobacter koseri]MEB2770011.1 hypothetical protein [Citrobacter koseri]WOJ28340.1 hypothetical protein R1221_11130 [Citrobacter koseri]